MKNKKHEVQNFNSNKNIKLTLKNSFKANYDIKTYLNDINKQIKLDKERFNDKKMLISLKSNYFGINNKPKKSLSLRTFNVKKNDSRNDIIYSPINKKLFLSIDDLLCNSIDSNINNALYFNNYNNYLKSKNSSSTINYHLNNAKTFSDSNCNISLENINKNKNKLKLKNNSKSSNSIINNIFITNERVIGGNRKSIALNNFDKNIRRIYKNYSTFTDKDLKYLKKYKYAVLDSGNLIKKYNLKKQVKLFEEEKSINKFFFVNREISRKNIILNLLNSEYNNMAIKEIMNKSKISAERNKLYDNEINFEEYKDNQKKFCKQIERILFQLERSNRTLIEKEYNINYDNNVIKENFQKLLYEINDYRIFGKYINQIMGGDTSRFDKKIFPKISDKILNLDYEALAKKTIINYSCFLNENNEFETNENFKIENTFIHQPIKMVDKYKELQNNIVLLIKQKKEIENETIQLKKENEIKLQSLKNRYLNLMHEYNSLNENYRKDSDECDYIETVLTKEKNKFYYLIEDFYDYIRNVSGKKYLLEENKYILLNYIHFINDNICDIQKVVDDLFVDLYNFEKNDKINFDKAVTNRRDEIKLFKQKLAFRKVINKNILIRKKAEMNKNRIAFITRKTEAPFHHPKKHKKIIILNEKQIEDLINEELITYNK